jgi:hypothetical protein
MNRSRLVPLRRPGVHQPLLQVVQLIQPRAQIAPPFEARLRRHQPALHGHGLLAAAQGPGEILQLLQEVTGMRVAGAEAL